MKLLASVKDLIIQYNCVDLTT